MKKPTGLILASLLLLPSMSCGWGPWDYLGPLAGYGFGLGYPDSSRYPDNQDDDRYSDNDADAAVLGAVLGTAAVIGTAIVVDGIRNQAAPSAPRLSQ